MHNAPLRPAILIALACLSIYTNPIAADQGHLIIIGGALKSDNHMIYDPIIHLGGGPTVPIAIVPTASGEWERSSKSYDEDFAGRGMEHRTIVPVHMDTYALAAEPATAGIIGNQRILFFTGGDQSRILAAYRPETGDTLSHFAMQRMLARGGVIAGSSAGAAMMSDPCIRWGNSEEALLLGESDAEDRGVRIDRGMGFFPYGLTDQHFLARGRYGRLAVALERTGTRLGFGICENRAFHADLAAKSITALGGPQALLVIDMAGATRDGLSLSGVRISLLGAGDRIDPTTVTMSPNPARLPLSHINAESAEPTTLPNPWGDFVLNDLLLALAFGPSPSASASSENFQVVVTRDNSSQFLAMPGVDHTTDPRTADFTALHVRLDFIANPAAPENARTLLAEIAAEAASTE